MVDLVLSVSEESLIEFFSNLPSLLEAREESLSVRQIVHRVQLALHPDKNKKHARAGEAFSRFTFIMKRIRYKDKSKRWNNYYCCK